MAKPLIDNDAEVDAKTRSKATALMLAAHKGTCIYVDSLEDAGRNYHRWIRDRITMEICSFSKPRKLCSGKTVN